MEDQAEMIYERFENGELTIDEASRAMGNRYEVTRNEQAANAAYYWALTNLVTGKVSYFTTKETADRVADVLNNS
jgi:hypothetical protein